jgi:hypothetical protein
MAKNWIKIETMTPDKPEVCVMATQLRMDPDAVLGKLVRLWSWAEMNKVNGQAVNVTKEFLDKVVGKKGFAMALERAGWLRGADGYLVFPNFARHNGTGAKGRALTAQRVRQHRERKRVGNDISVTNEEAMVSETADEQVNTVSSFNPDNGVITNVNALKNNELNSCIGDDNELSGVETAEKDQGFEGVVAEDRTPEDWEVVEAQGQGSGDDFSPVLIEEVSLVLTDGADSMTGRDEVDEVDDDAGVAGPGEVQPKVKRSRVTSGSGRRVGVANPPDQPFLF